MVSPKPQTHRVDLSYLAHRESPAETYDWIELEFVTASNSLKAGISCPTGLRILDLLNTPCSGLQNTKSEFIELQDRSNPNNTTRTIFIKKEALLFVSAPDENLRRGLGANGDFKVYPFIEKTSLRMSVQIQNYLLIGNIFMKKGQDLLTMLNDDMFFLPITDVTLALDSAYLGNRPFVAINKQQIVSAYLD